MQITLKQAIIYKQGCLALAERCRFMLEHPNDDLFKKLDQLTQDKATIQDTMEAAFREAAYLGQAIEIKSY